MSVSNDNFAVSDQSWARFLYQAHGYISIPTYRALEYIARLQNPLTPNIFDHNSSKVSEFAYRAFAPTALLAGAVYLCKAMAMRQIGVSSLEAVAAVVGYEAARFLVHLLAYNAQEKKYIHIRTEVPEVSGKTPKIAMLNILGFPAGLNYSCGGCPPLRKRFDEIVKMIRQQHAEVVVIQECLMDGLTPEMFIAAFKGEYAHFFIHNGPNAVVNESGLLVMTKCPVYDYSFTQFTEQGFGMTRGFATLKIKADPKDDKPLYAIVATHMEHGNSTPIRKKQLAQIRQAANQMNDVELVLFAGDSNINIKNPPEAKETEIEQILIGAYKGEKATCTNQFDKQWDPNPKNLAKPNEEWVDQIAVIRRDGPAVRENQESFRVEDALTETEIVAAYEGNNSQTARSDHHGLVRKLKPIPQA
jgi:hypothetical protein